MRAVGRDGGRAVGVVAACLALAAPATHPASVTHALPPYHPTAFPPDRPTALSPDSSLTVYLMTFGPGARVWERFGHNAIWIHDPARGTDQAYNYGLFDFHQESFLLRFIRGQMWYWMQGFPADRYLRQYQRDNRSIWIQELEIAPQERVRLRDFLEWNERPENRFYHYDYYRDNCSTRVRDALDRAVGGRIQAQLAGVQVPASWRFHTQRLTANDPLIFTGLLLALSDSVDRPLSAWEEMFLPLQLREHIRAVTVAGPDGSPVPLVRSERTVFVSTGPNPPDAPPDWLGWYLLLGLAIGSGAIGLAVAGRRGGPARWGLALLTAVWGMASGIAGVVLAVLWGLTDHVMAYGNENLLQTNPLALALPVLAVGIGLGRPRAIRLAGSVSVVLLALALAGMAAKLLPAFDQANGPIIALALPAHLGVATALALSGYLPWTRPSAPRASS